MYCRSVPFCAGILSIGMEMSSKSGGIGTGMSPNIAYLAQSRATRATMGIAGNGSPLQSIVSMTRVRSSPVTVTVPDPPPLPAWTSMWVATPSKSGWGVPSRVTTSRIRSGGVTVDTLFPAAMRKIVLSADFAENWNVSWKPLGLPAAVVTWTWSSASMTTRGAGIGTIGPMRRVIWIPLASIGHSRNAFGQGDAEHAARDLDQLVRPHRAIGVADPPELQGVAQVARRELVQPLAGRDPVLLEQGEALGRRHEAPAHVGDDGPIGKPELRGLDP